MSHELDFLVALERIIEERLQAPRPGSYVAALGAGGERRVAQKLGEEAVELALAAVGDDAEAQLEEAADLLFHFLVLLRVKGLRLADVADRLEQRHRNA